MSAKDVEGASISYKPDSIRSLNSQDDVCFDICSCGLCRCIAINYLLETEYRSF